MSMVRSVQATLVSCVLSFRHLFQFLSSYPITTICGFILVRVAYLLFFHPLSDIPGPNLAAITDLWKCYKVYRKSLYTDLQRLHARYGDVVRIGPNEVSIVSPDDVSAIYGPKSIYLKGPFYRAWQTFGRGHFATLDPIIHRNNRQVVAGAYSLRFVTSLERYCDSTNLTMLDLLNKLSTEGRIVDLGEVFEAYAYDTISRIGFGKNFGLLSSLLFPSIEDENISPSSASLNRSMLKAMSEAHHQVAVWGMLSQWNWLVSTWPISWFCRALMGNSGPSLFIKYGTTILEERIFLKKNDVGDYFDGEEKDMLDWFLAIGGRASSRSRLEYGEVLKNCLSIILAGADTTQASMMAFILHVYSHPSTLVKLRAEIDTVLSEYPDGPPSSLSYAEVLPLEYLWACLWERFRLFPPIGLPLQRVVPKGGRPIGGRFYNEGTLIGMLPRLVHQDPRAYGHDANQWKPERWLEQDRSTLEAYNLTFGQGTRACLGKNVSLMEMAKLLPLIVYYYNFEFIGRIRGWENGGTDRELNDNGEQDPVWKVNESWFAVPRAFWCNIRER